MGFYNRKIINKKRICLRTISLGLIAVLCLSEVSHAASFSEVPTVFPSSKLLDLSRDPARFEVPVDFSTLREVHVGTNGTFIIHIQDPHSNFSGQKNLASALDGMVSKYGISLVLVEGASKEATLTSLRELAPSSEVRKRVAKSFLIQGEITGEEYLNLTSDHPIKIMGIEDESLYSESVQSYGRLASRREATLEYLKTIRWALGRLKQKFYPAEILAYEKIKGISGDGFDVNLKGLLGIIQNKKIDLSGLPDVQTLLVLDEKEKRIDFGSANLEQTALLENLRSKRGVKGLLEQWGRMRLTKDQRISQLALIENTLGFARERGMTLSPYPNLVLYAEYLKEFSELDLDQTLDEWTQAEDRVYRALLSSPDARLVRAIDRYLAILDSAYRIRMSTSEFQLFEANEPDFSTVSYLAFINRKLADFGLFSDIVVYKPLLEEGQDALRQFYHSVDRRDLAFVQNTEMILSEANQKIAVLISGGYHTSHLKKLMQEKGYSYAVMAPLVTAETDQKKYEKLLLGPSWNKTKKLEVTQGESKLQNRSQVEPESGPSPSKIVNQKDGIRARAIATEGARLTRLATALEIPFESRAGAIQRVLGKRPRVGEAAVSIRPEKPSGARGGKRLAQEYHGGSAVLESQKRVDGLIVLPDSFVGMLDAFTTRHLATLNSLRKGPARGQGARASVSEDLGVIQLHASEGEVQKMNLGTNVDRSDDGIRKIEVFAIYANDLLGMIAGEMDGSDLNQVVDQLFVGLNDMVNRMEEKLRSRIRNVPVPSQEQLDHMGEWVRGKFLEKQQKAQQQREAIDRYVAFFRTIMTPRLPSDTSPFELEKAHVAVAALRGIEGHTAWGDEFNVRTFMATKTWNDNNALLEDWGVLEQFRRSIAPLRRAIDFIRFVDSSEIAFDYGLVASKLLGIASNRAMQIPNRIQANASPDLRKSVEDVSARLVNVFESRIRMIQGTQKPEDFDLDDLIGRAVMNFSIPKQNLRYVKTEPPVARVYLDRLSVTKIIAELLSNASTVLGIRNIEISAKIDSGTNALVIEVKDDGDGVPDDKLEDIFRYGITSRVEDGNTGMGLFEARFLAEKILGGTLTVSNTSDLPRIDSEGYQKSDGKKGAVFTLRVPLPSSGSRTTAVAQPAEGLSLLDAHGARGLLPTTPITTKEEVEAMMDMLLLIAAENEGVIPVGITQNKFATILVSQKDSGDREIRLMDPKTVDGETTAQAWAAFEVTMEQIHEAEIRHASARTVEKQVPEPESFEATGAARDFQSQNSITRILLTQMAKGLKEDKFVMLSIGVDGQDSDEMIRQIRELKAELEGLRETSSNHLRVFFELVNKNGERISGEFLGFESETIPEELAAKQIERLYSGVLGEELVERAKSAEAGFLATEKALIDANTYNIIPYKPNMRAGIMVAIADAEDLSVRRALRTLMQSEIGAEEVSLVKKVPKNATAKTYEDKRLIVKVLATLSGQLYQVYLSIRTTATSA